MFEKIKEAIKKLWNDEQSNSFISVNGKKKFEIVYKQGATKDFTALLENKSLTHENTIPKKEQTSQIQNSNNFKKIKEFFKKWFGNKDNLLQAQSQTKFTNKTQEEVKEVIDKWDLSPQNIHTKKQRLVVEVVSENESKQINKEFAFKQEKQLLREIRAYEVQHALKEHGDKKTEEARGQIAITKDDIYVNYPKITKDYDLREITDSSIIYAKQINGYFVAIEEALIGQDKLIFKTNWKVKGALNKEILLRDIRSQKGESPFTAGNHQVEPEMQSVSPAPEALAVNATIPNQSLKNTETQSKNAIKDTLGDYGNIVKTLNSDKLSSDYTLPSNDDNGTKLKSLVDASEIQSSNKQGSSSKRADKPKIKTMFGNKNNESKGD